MAYRESLVPAARAAAPSPAALAQRRRANTLRWLRKVHGWLGLWGAVFGFLFGATGIVLAHRAILKLPVNKGEQSVVQYRLDRLPATPAELAVLVARDFGYEGRRPRVVTEPAHQVAWNQVAVRQPERWELHFAHPARNAKVEYFVGNGYARIEKFDATWIGTLTRLHMATGVDALWVLLLDSFAGSLMVLALTGTLLWTQMRPARLLTGAVLLGAPMLAAIWLAASL